MSLETVSSETPSSENMNLAPGAHVVVIGAGPSGLVAAWTLVQAGIRVTLLEKAHNAGGLGGTHTVHWRDGTYRFDYGGHRFITHNAELLRLVESLLGDDLLSAQRHSVIRLGGRTYDYPLALGNLLKTAPFPLLAGAALDLLTMPLRSRANLSDDFASWTEARFGRTLYRHFFEGYTGKLWGVNPRDLSSDWAEQRISLVDLKQVARLLLPASGQGPRTYARSYRYPKHGFGMICERLLERIAQQRAEIRTGTAATGFIRNQERVTAVETAAGVIPCDAVISTLPLPDVVRLTGGDCTLRFRGMRFLNLALACDNVSPYTWQYLSDPDILATRLQEPRRRSPFMAPPGFTSLMLEVPCDPGDGWWDAPDAVLYERGLADLKRLGVDTTCATGEYFSVRSATAYPCMVRGYEQTRQQAIRHLSPLRNLIQCGRQGTFRYVFTDTAMEMGQMAAQGLIDGIDNRKQIYQHRNERTVIECDSVA